MFCQGFVLHYVKVYTIKTLNFEISNQFVNKNLLSLSTIDLTGTITIIDNKDKYFFVLVFCFADLTKAIERDQREMPTTMPMTTARTIL